MVLKRVGEDGPTSPAATINTNMGLSSNNNNPIDPFLSQTDVEAARSLTGSGRGDDERKQAQESNPELESARFRFPELKETLPQMPVKSVMETTHDEDLLVQDVGTRDLAATLAKQLRDQEVQQRHTAVMQTQSNLPSGIGRAVPGGLLGSGKSTDGTASTAAEANSNTSLPQTLGGLTGSDRQLSEFLPHYVPGHSYPTSSNNDTSAQVAAHSTGASTNPFRDGSIRPQLTGHEHHHSSSSNIFDADLSSFDASSSRAMPGQRGGPAVGMEGWTSDADTPVAKTWEEDQQRRRLAEFELMKRKEEADKSEMERRLREEFWRGEEERYGPVVTQPRSVKQQDASVGASVPANITYSGGAMVVPGDAYYIPVSNPPATHTTKPEAAQVQPHSIPQSIQPHQSVPPPQLIPQPQPTPSPQPTANLEASQNPAGSSSTPQKDPSAEVYHIKHIKWIDPVTKKSRCSPILLQNENGPCPLLALVNALILANPPDSTTSLSEALRVREHISLGLLLDAVFDGVVAKATSGNIDVGDLFTFLLNLRTGMNVNPRFVVPKNSPIPPPSSMLGTFENTKEMKLYNSFEIPLYHGWIPYQESHTYKILQEVAPTYEEAQNLILGEEEILLRISTAAQGSNDAELSEQDQVVIKNAAVVREWLESSRTQLSAFGIDILTRFWGGDGKVGILFRNDHFLTVMSNTIVEGPPATGREGKPVLFALVTDMGYSGYEEVVWESLVSVSGAGAQFFAGDFRPVGGNEDGNPHRSAGQRGHPVRSMLDVNNNTDGEGWETVGGGRRGKNQNQNRNNGSQIPPLLPNRDQQNQGQNQRRTLIQVLTGRGYSWQAPSTSPNQQHQQRQQYSSIESRISNNTSSSSINSNNIHFTPESLPPRHSSARATQGALFNIVPPPPGEVTTDYDLALALQLQEEEEERERQRQHRELQRQNQRQQPSQRQGIGSHSLPNIPPRPLPSPVPPVSRVPHSSPLLPRHTPDGGESDAPPPPYESINSDHPAAQMNRTRAGITGSNNSNNSVIRRDNSPSLDQAVGGITRRRSEVMRVVHELSPTTAYQAMQNQQGPGAGAGAGAGAGDSGDGRYAGMRGGEGRYGRHSWDNTTAAAATQQECHYSGQHPYRHHHGYSGYEGYGHPGEKKEKECIVM